MDVSAETHSLAWCVEGTSPAVQCRAPDEIVRTAHLGVEGAEQDDARAVRATIVDGALPSGVPRNAALQAAAYRGSGKVQGSAECSAVGPDMVRASCTGTSRTTISDAESWAQTSPVEGIMAVRARDGKCRRFNSKMPRFSGQEMDREMRSSRWSVVFRSSTFTSRRCLLVTRTTT